MDLGDNGRGFLIGCFFFFGGGGDTVSTGLREQRATGDASLQSAVLFQQGCAEEVMAMASG